MWFAKYRIGAFLYFASIINSFGQELFPLNEPASSVPKGVAGIRFINQTYTEVYTKRNLEALRIMYGLTPRLSVMATVSISNHHNKKLPPDLINHSHVGSQTNYFSQAIKRGVKYPYRFNGIYLYSKYRFLSFDGKFYHFRATAYGEWSGVNLAHDEAEPKLMDDTGGYGYGLIVTLLKNRFAASITSGVIKPNSYFETQPDFTGGPDLPTKIYYGDALKYNLSFGYRLAPKRYNDYNQPNWNLYVEFIGKKYDAAKVIQNGVEITSKTIALEKGSYLEIHPGIQYIIKSNLRIDVSAGFSLISFSYAHFTPVWTIGVQRFFFRKNKDNEQNKDKNYSTEAF